MHFWGEETKSAQGPRNDRGGFAGEGGRSKVRQEKKNNWPAEEPIKAQELSGNPETIVVLEKEEHHKTEAGQGKVYNEKVGWKRDTEGKKNWNKKTCNINKEGTRTVHERGVSNMGPR